MARKVNAGPKDGQLPLNPSWIEFTRTDGDSAYWPKNTEPVVNDEGRLDYMKPLDIEHPLSIRWRTIIGRSMAGLLNLPDRDKREYVLKSWPEGYHFYDHNKATAQGDIRHDLYLVGSKYVARFRSPSEFVPHAVWLINDPTMDRANCQCKYCSRRKQKEISDQFGLPTVGGAIGGTERTVRVKEQKPRLPQHREFDVFTCKAPKEVKRLDRLKYFALPERENDLRALLCPRQFKSRRWVRERELVWVKLSSPIKLGQNPIIFWPGLVESSELRTEILKKEDALAMDVDINPNTAVNGQEERLTPTPDVPWVVRQYSYYKVKLVFVSRSVLVTEDAILPYQAYAPSNGLLSDLQNVRIDIDELAKSYVSSTTDANEENLSDEMKAIRCFQSFDPFSEEEPTSSPDPRHLVNAAGAFALSIQQASRFVEFWTPSGGWTVELTIDNPDDAKGSRTAESQLANEKLYSARLYGAEPSRTRLPGVQLFSQQRYQGLWWGSERIWMGELVRLQFGRSLFVPGGSNVVKKPAKPSRSRRRVFSGVLDGLPPGSAGETEEDTIGAAARGLFMRLDGIMSVRIPREGGRTSAKCRISGPLYELVDDDWEEEDEGEIYATQTKPTDSSTESADATQLSASTQTAPVSSAVPVPDVTSTSVATPVLGKRPPSTNPTDLELEEAMSFWNDGDETANGASAASASAANGHSSNKPQSSRVEVRSKPGILSALPPYPLPPPPQRYKFRPILKDGYEAVLDVEYLSGRYYPGLFQHPVMEVFLRNAAENPLSEDNQSFWALDGLVPGFHNSVAPFRFNAKRINMIHLAQDVATKELLDYWRLKIEGEKAEESQKTASVG